MARNVCVLSLAETRKIKEALNTAKGCLMCHGVSNNNKEEAIATLREAQTIFIKKEKRRNEKH